MDVRHGILDAGYCSGKNIRDLYNNRIPFLIRLPNNALAIKWDVFPRVLVTSEPGKYANLILRHCARMKPHYKRIT